MRHRRAFLAAAFLALSVTALSRPASALPRRNRLTAEVAPITWGSYVVPGSDGHFSEKDATGLAFYGEYGRVVTRWLEVGAGFSFGKPYGVSLNVLRPYAFARGFGGFMDNSLELGGALRLGPGFSWLGLGDETIFYAGGAAGVTIDVRYWVSKRAGIRAGFEAWIGLLEEAGGAEFVYFRDTTLLGLSLGPTVGFSYRFW